MNKWLIKLIFICGVTILWVSICSAGGGRVSYPDGQPVVGAEVHVHLQEVVKFKLTANANGRFTMPTVDFLDAFVQIKVPDGNDFATVNLPVAIFESGEVAIVLQPKR